MKYNIGDVVEIAYWSDAIEYVVYTGCICFILDENTYKIFIAFDDGVGLLDVKEKDVIGLSSNKEIDDWENSCQKVRNLFELIDYLRK